LYSFYFIFFVFLRAAISHLVVLLISP